MTLARRLRSSGVAPAPGGVDLAPVPGLRPAARRPDPGRQRRPDEGGQALRPEQGVRLVSYAMHWIKAEIHEYILKNWRMVKVATTKAQRKLFFNLRSMKQGLLKRGRRRTETHRSTLTAAEVDTVAREPQRQAGGSARDGDALGRRRRGARAAVGRRRRGELRPDRLPPTRRTSRRACSRRAPRLAGQRRHHLRAGRADARSRRIVEERWLKVNDDSSGGMTLHELAGRLRRQRRAHPPDRGRGDEEEDALRRLSLRP